MRVIARIGKEDPGLVTQLRNECVMARVVKNATIVELPVLDEVEGDMRYLIPDAAKGAKLFIDCSEYGGGMSNTGLGVIVCGASGKPLKPYRIPNGGHLACGHHETYFTSYEEDVARLVKKEIWVGYADELPTMYGQFQDAVNAAVEKANCYHCREPHYIAH